MINMKFSKYIPGVLAVVIYFFVLTMLMLYFNTKDTEDNKKYVKKDERRIQVAISSSLPSTPVKTVEKKKISKPIKNEKKKVKPKPKPKPKKKIVKEKIVKKKVIKKSKPKPKKRNNTKDLFSNVKTTKKKNIINVSNKPIKTKPKKDIFKMTDKKDTATKRINDSLKNQKNMDSGVENAYFAKVQRMLESWPAQSDFAGQELTAVLFIDTNGFFEFKIKVPSSNPDFNQAVELFLEQLQEFGFGMHNGGRTYEFEAEFEAKN